jgi:hypothetical protein
MSSLVCRKKITFASDEIKETVTELLARMETLGESRQGMYCTYPYIPERHFSGLLIELRLSQTKFFFMWTAVSDKKL